MKGPKLLLSGLNNILNKREGPIDPVNVFYSQVLRTSTLVFPGQN
jgi:hypothetical protein